MSDTTNPIEIFRAGTHTAMNGVTLTFSEADLDATANAYGLARHAAPIVVGHPAADAPAYGWVRALTRAGDVLQAHPEQIDPAFAELVNAGRFKKISASFYAPDSPANPAPGVYYLRHVGFLGAQPPAVKGLRDARFGEGETGILTLEFGEDIAEPPTVPDPLESPMPDPTVPDPEIAAREAALAARQTDLDAREAALAAQETAARVKADTDFAEGLIAQGRLLPKDRAGLVAFLATVPAEAALAFGEGQDAFQGASAAWLKTFLASLPVQVDFSERTAGEASLAPPRFSAPEGVQVDPARLQLHARALAFQEAHPGATYTDAVLTVSQER
ncbi:hypothetical protein [Thiocystis violascens]|uniref:Mu-like prophage I protein n=1 Tax=Thiocystis violascens (strain ATCC 17096 / DSM 198 / 6111) TaxID=765911 RepID=I3YGW1_THIV6|nr:hypothetical protein [Thiocystis violascens]AFL76229.1 hypothetical protein Thivi_4426 [Thiocystis violascens DSM 198]